MSLIRCRRVRGFTLLEVMIAMAILIMGLGALLGSQGISIQMSDYSNRLSQAALLAQGKMLDVEHMLLKDSMDVLDNCSEGDFRDEGFRNFKWKACAYKLEMDDGAAEALTERFMSLLTGFGVSGDGSGETVPDLDSLGDGSNPLADRMASQIGMAVSMIPSFLQQLEDKIRKVRVEVTWKDAITERSVVVERFVTELGSDASDGPPPTDGDAQEATDTDQAIDQLQNLLNKEVEK